MGTAILEVVQGIAVLRVELEGDLIDVESVVVFPLFQQAVAHVKSRLRLQFGVGRDVQHLLEGFHGLLPMLLLVEGIAEVELGLRAGGLGFQGLAEQDFRFGEVISMILSISFPYLFLNRLGGHGQDREHQCHKQNNSIHRHSPSFQIG